MKTEVLKKLNQHSKGPEAKSGSRSGDQRGERKSEDKKCCVYRRRDRSRAIGGQRNNSKKTHVSKKGLCRKIRPQGRLKEHRHRDVLADRATRRVYF